MYKKRSRLNKRCSKLSNRLSSHSPADEFNTKLFSGGLNTLDSIQQCIAETLSLNRLGADSLPSLIQQFQMIVKQGFPDQPFDWPVDVDNLDWLPGSFGRDLLQKLAKNI
jgi:hypothetical protein